MNDASAKSALSDGVFAYANVSEISKHAARDRGELRAMSFATPTTTTVATVPITTRF